MELSFDRYRLRIGYGARNDIAREALKDASRILRLDGPGKDQVWLAVRPPEAREQHGPFWAIRLRYHRQPEAPVALAMAPNTDRLFIGAGSDHWVVDLKAQMTLAHREGDRLEQFHAFNDGVLVVDRSHLWFYGPFGRARWNLAIDKAPWTYVVEAGTLRLTIAGDEQVFPLVGGPEG